MLSTLETHWTSSTSSFPWWCLLLPFSCTWCSVSALDYIRLRVFVFNSSQEVFPSAVIFYKWAVDWNSRMLSATCLDPDGDTWGSSAYNGEWTPCDGSGDGTCTPWGYSCTGYEDTVAKCPLNFGGTGDGCQVRRCLAFGCRLSELFPYISDFVPIATKFDHYAYQHCPATWHC